MSAASEILRSWRAPTTQQDHLRHDFLAWVTTHPDAMLRSCAPHHVTASALVISHDHSRVALVLHRKFGRWLQTGGHVEPHDNDLVAAALREATEESGIAGLVIDPTPVWLSRHRVNCWPGGDHLDVQFVAIAPPDAIVQVSEESEQIAWWHTDELPPDADVSVRELVQAAVLRLASPASGSLETGSQETGCPSRRPN